MIAVHADASPAVRTARRSARPACARHDQRQPVRRADHHRRRRGPRPPGRPRRRVAASTTGRIHVPCDDSVMRVADGQVLPVRRSRGYAPLPIALPVPVRPALAVGGDLKNTFCVGDGRYAWMSAHVGDMDDLATLRAFDTATTHLGALTGVAPEVLVADAHPRYRSAAWAHREAAGRPVRTVQHHHAHIASAMADNGHDGATRVLGFAFDGTGYGATAQCGAARCCSPTTPTSSAWPTCLCVAARRRRRRAQPVPDGAVAPTRRRRAMGRAAALRGRVHRRPSGASSPSSSNAGWAACRPRAWVGCSTPCRHWLACATASSTRPKRRCGSKSWPMTGCLRSARRTDLPSTARPSTRRR